MASFDLLLFHAMAGGIDPDPLVLWLASWIARYSGWLCGIALAWALWRRPAQWRGVMLAGVAAGVTALMVHPLAAAIGRPRPFMLGLAPALIPHGGRGSLPSAHASVMFSIAFTLLLRPLLRSAGIAVALVALATGWARIYVGVHFPADIAAGAVLGGTVALLLLAIERGTRHAVDARAAYRQRGSIASDLPVKEAGDGTASSHPKL